MPAPMPTVTAQRNHQIHFSEKSYFRDCFFDLLYYQESLIMKLLSTLVFSFFSMVLMAQSTMVNTLNYNSTTRDTVIAFPEGDHNQYKKIIMHYSMRCKDGLVSPPVSGQTNVGCGEWDYSCNTNLVDSTQVDSLKRVDPDHVISGFSESLYEYTTQPTYTILQQSLKDVDYTTSNLVSIIDAGDGDESGLYDMALDGDVKSHLFIVKAEDIMGQGVAAGDIGRMRWDVFGNESQMNNLKISMRGTSAEEVSAAEYFSGTWTEVYQNNFEMTFGSFLDFHENFTWDGSSNILVKMSYEAKSDNPVRLTGDRESANPMLTVSGNNDKYVTCGASGNFVTDEGIPQVSDEITVSFWSFGDYSLPVNTYLCEGLDQANRRQLNMHLPWSNGQVYWDCGNNGSNYDRINKAVDPSDFKNKWTHWAFTKNTNTGVMNMYLDGELFHTGSDKFHPIDVKRFVLGSSAGATATPYPGSLDDFQIWNKELTQEQIQTGMRNRIDPSHPDYESLVMYYDFNGDISAQLTDMSSYGNDLTANGQLLSRDWKSHQLVKNISMTDEVPNFFLLMGDYQYEVTETILNDTLQNLPARVDRYVLDGTDRVLDETFYYYTVLQLEIL